MNDKTNDVASKTTNDRANDVASKANNDANKAPINEATIFDLIIIGEGPAGLSAAITARARNKEVLIVSNPAHENPLAASKLVDNYPGMPGATGLHVLTTMEGHAQQLGVHFLQTRAISIVPMQSATGTTFSVTTSSMFLQSKAIIIASGKASGGNPFEGEMDYLGRGVSYCATCDGMLHRTSTVLVAGLSPEAVDEANFLAELGATVHYVAKEIPHGLDTKIYTHAGTLAAIEGDALGVTRALINEHAQGTTSAQRFATNAIEVQAVFILRPGIAPTSMLPTLELEEGFIKVDARMATNIEGVFAAGDCTGKPLQVAKAVGDGQKAVLSAVEYLQTQK